MTVNSQNASQKQTASLEDRPNPSRVVIEAVEPEIDAGRYPIKRVVGEEVVVEADVYTDGHDSLAAVLCYRRVDETSWREVPMQPLVNDRWEGRFVVAEMANYEYTVRAWIDTFETWRKELAKKSHAGQEVSSELREGAEMVVATAHRALRPDAERLTAAARMLAEADSPLDRIEIGLSQELSQMMACYPPRERVAEYERILKVAVERERALFGAWYELFPRSTPSEPGRHGTFRDVEARLPYIAEMGFDIVYLPPIHPIGRTFRKGPNNSLECGPDDPGSPWAIGGAEGGHKAVHPALGTLDDFDRLVAAANELGLEIALDIAYQCSPDHPYVTEHPSWFKHRPDGTIKYAENPPKKYQDIYPLNFDSPDWHELWQELYSVVKFWVYHGVKVFRVDNPHTKAFPFWEWMIGRVRNEHPEVIFLSEAFTRPKVMRQLAKAGFSQSYTYFTWRNTKRELTEYLTELTQSPVRDYMRPNLFPNTPDILHEYLQVGGRPAFQARLVLAATLSASYGIYGPAYELCEGRAVPGSEEYLDSEKYQQRDWDWDAPHSLREYIARINSIRRDNRALAFNDNLRFIATDNEQLIAYWKATPELTNVILVVVNLDSNYTHSGWLQVPLAELGLEESHPFQVHDLLTDARYFWHGERNYVELNPHASPAHIFRVRRKIKTEHDFDYYM